MQGSLGIPASANLNPERRFPSLFEPVHGSAPDIAGRGVANPTAAIWAGAMMLEHLGAKDAAQLVMNALERALESGRARTPISRKQFDGGDGGRSHHDDELSDDRDLGLYRNNFHIYNCAYERLSFITVVGPIRYEPGPTGSLPAHFLLHGFVRDQDRSLRFYVDQLGFSLVVDNRFEGGGRWIAVAPPDGSAILALSLRRLDPKNMT